MQASGVIITLDGDQKICALFISNFFNPGLSPWIISQAASPGFQVNFSG
jgi:hypothetical protein